MGVVGLFPRPSSSKGAEENVSPTVMTSIQRPVSRHDLMFDSEGRIRNWQVVRRAVKRYGVAADPVSRRLLYPFLLGVFSAGSTREERAAELRRLRHVTTKLVFICEKISAQGKGDDEEDGDVNDDTDRAYDTYDRTHVTYESDGGDGGDTKPHASFPAGSPASGFIRVSGEEHAQSPGTGKEEEVSSAYASFTEAHRLIVIDSVRAEHLDVEESGDWDTSVFWGTMFGSNVSRNGQYDGREGTSGVRERLAYPVVCVGDGLPGLQQVHSPLPKLQQQVASGRQPIWASEFATTTIDASCKTHARHARRLTLRLINMLSIYAVHDPENGYCQGMSDLGAVFVAIEPDDAIAFACFEKLMRTARQNFQHDEKGIKEQLRVVGNVLRSADRQLYKKLQALGEGGGDCPMFVYRMVVVLMRRELPVDDALRLWEMSWAYDDEDEETVMGGREHGPASGGARTISLPDDDEGAFQIRSNTMRSTIESLSSLVINRGSRDLDTRRRPRSTPSTLSWRGATSTVAHVEDTGEGQRKPTFFLQFVASVILMDRKFILNECKEYDDLMRHFNGVSIDFEATAARARQLHTSFVQGATLIERLYS